MGMGNVEGDRSSDIVLPEGVTLKTIVFEGGIDGFLDLTQRVIEALELEREHILGLGLNLHWRDAAMPELVSVDLPGSRVDFKTRGFVRPGDFVTAYLLAETIVERPMQRGDHIVSIRPKYEDPRSLVASRITYEGTYDGNRWVLNLSHLGSMAGIQIPGEARVYVFR